MTTPNPPNPANGAKIEDGVYTIQNKASSTFLNLKDGNTENETPIVGYEDLTSKSNFFNQNWYIKRAPVNLDSPKARALYTILNVTSGTAVNLYKSSTSEGAVIRGLAPEGTANQQWYFLANEDGSYNIINIQSNLAVDLDDGKKDNDTKVHGQVYDNKDNQHWILKPRQRSIRSIQNLLLDGNLVRQLPAFYSIARPYIIPPKSVIEEIYANWAAVHNFQLRSPVFDQDNFASVFKAEVESWGYDNVRVPVGLLFGTLWYTARNSQYARNWTVTDDLQHVIVWDAQTGKWSSKIETGIIGESGMLANFGSF